MAETLSNVVQSESAFDIVSTDPKAICNYDLLLVGTPVEGFKPAKETTAFLENIPQVKDKIAILFCTYALWRGFTFLSLNRLLNKKGYRCILKVSKRKVTDQTDFSDAAINVEKALNRVELANWLVITNVSKKLKLAKEQNL